MRKPEEKPHNPRRKLIGTKILDDVLQDEENELSVFFEEGLDGYINRLWESNQEIYILLKEAKMLEEARDRLYQYLERVERKIFLLKNGLHILEKSTVRESIRVFRSVIAPINEYRTGFSALKILWLLAKGEIDLESSVLTPGFFMEFINLFRGVTGMSNIYVEGKPINKEVPDFLKLKGKEAAVVRMGILDEMGADIKSYLKKYSSGLDEKVYQKRLENRTRILQYFNGNLDDWNSYKWHIRHVIKDLKAINDLIKLNREQQEAIELAVQNKIAFGITPYYLSLMDFENTTGLDHAVRAQVIPPKDYVDIMCNNRRDRGVTFDFMGEHDTSPINLITRRYPMIAIMKPFNTCAQICVYCQRNWEIERVLEPKAMASKASIEKALNWFDEHPEIGEVLITGGDPLVMKDDQLDYLMGRLAEKKQIFRIRIGSRIPVVLPMRITDKLIEVFLKYHRPPHLEVAVVTHFEHSYEVTPESMQAVQKIRKAGLSVYNQTVYTMENSRRFELAKLRRDLKSIGVDPYYTFNMKGKRETGRYMVPVARILQELKEEARMLPGLDRTDEPVFNVPRLGKNHLRAAQDHRLVMILANGSRVYEFHPWEKNIKPVPPYNYTDVPIYEYLKELAKRGEKLSAYRTIWFYY
ncbi:KamA family radical SAM protein [Marinilabiliaceae bacterium JC017]|nr:KamA family radical SAM protein [Marinilabiliaceae bacterium JC017]